MIRLLKIELQKIIYSRQVWIILGLYILLIIPVAYLIDSISLGGSSNGEAMHGGMAINFFNFPAVWHNMAYLFTWFQLFLGIIIISLVTTEFSQRTLRQNIIDGLTKWEIIWSKELVIILLSSISTLLLIAFTLIFGTQGEYTSFWVGFKVIPVYFICTMLYLNFAYFLSFGVKKSGLAIGLLLLYSIIIENLITFKLPDTIAQYFPMKMLSVMIPNPLGSMLSLESEVQLTLQYTLVSIAYIGLFILLIKWMLNKGHAAK
jgi:ABC-2 type transport system permease protein